MTRKSMLTLCAALFSVAVMVANVSVEKRSESTITQQLRKLLSHGSIAVDKNDVKARVLFRVNAEGRIEVLRVASERKDLKWFIKKKLEGKRIFVSDEAFGEEFVFNVRVTS